MFDRTIEINKRIHSKCMSKHVNIWRLLKPKRSLHLLPGPELLGNVSSSKLSHFAFLRGWIPRIVMHRKLQPLAFQPDSNSMNNAASPSKHPCQVTQVPLVGRAFYWKKRQQRRMCWQRGSWWEGLAPNRMVNYSTSPRRECWCPGTCGMCGTSGSAAHTRDKEGWRVQDVPHTDPLLPGHCPLPPSPCERLAGSFGRSLCLYSRRAQPSTVLQSSE